MQVAATNMYAGLKNVYMSQNLTGEVLLQPSKYIHNCFWGSCTREDRIKAIAYGVFDLLLQLTCLPLTVVGCSIKLLHIKSFIRKSALLRENALQRFDEIQALWQTNFIAFDRQYLDSNRQRSTDEERTESESISISDARNPEVCTRIRERFSNLMIEREKRFSLITGIGTQEGRFPTGELSYVVTLYFRGQ